jgi:iron complex outermembrane receptor protein
VGDTIELGSRYQKSRPGGLPLFWIDLAGFARHSRNLVTYVRTAQGYLHPLNRDRARSVGGELAAGVAPFAGLQLMAHLDLLDARDTSPSRVVKNDLLPFTSRAAAFVRARYEHELGLKALHSAALGARYAFQSSRFADPAGLAVIPAQRFFDLEAELTALGRAIVTRARISNLLDAQRFDVVGFPLPGRSFFLSTEVTW